MTRENVKKNIGIISAFAEGKVIQILNERSEWVDLTEREGLPMGTLEESPNIFRIKPESKYRPFEDSEECWQEMLKHEPFGWVKTKDKGVRLYIVGLHQNRAFTQIGHNYDEALDEFAFADGTPFGILEEE